MFNLFYYQERDRVIQVSSNTMVVFCLFCFVFFTSRELGRSLGSFGLENVP